jgi:hypothetical protein
LNQFIDFNEISFGGNAIEWDAITSNPIVLTILKWFRFKTMRWMQYLHHSALFDYGLGFMGIVGFPWLQHIPYLADVTMETNASH